eukprot:3658583-Rhodomonas_salina.2
MLIFRGEQRDSNGEADNQHGGGGGGGGHAHGIVSSPVSHCKSSPARLPLFLCCCEGRMVVAIVAAVIVSIIRITNTNTNTTAMHH